MEGKKISFGFMKTKKVQKLPIQEKKDFIECVEEKSIKVIGGDEVKEIAPLVIPMKPNTLITAERLKEIAEKVESELMEPETTTPDTKPQETALENETLDEMAVRELLEESKKAVKVDTQELTLSLPAKSLTSGEKESKLDDYESVPVQDFGLAMLRGMGWTKSNEKSTFKAPQLRPKGLGLGADKVVKDKQKVTKNSKEEELTIVKNAYIKITTGKYSGYYGKVLSLDEDNGRVMVDITVKKETVSLSEFMMHPVTKAEFDKESKVINANSFDQYKKNEGQNSSKNSKESRASERNNDEPKREQERSSKDNNNYKRSNENKDKRERSRDRSNRVKYRESSEEYNKSKNKRDRDNSLESLSDSNEKKHKKERRSKKQYSSMESLDSDTERKSKRREKSYDSASESDKVSKRREKDRKRYDSDTDDKQSRSKDKKRHDSNKKKKDKYKKYDSDSESDRKSKKVEKNKYSSDSESDHRRSKRSDTPEGKRDIDKKRKGKKKKRDRDRSPNYRKHRK